MENRILNALKSHLFDRTSETVFTILDGAMVPDLPQNLASFKPQSVCLYRGELEPDMAEVAPYLAILNREDDFTDWVICNGWGRRWGLFGRSDGGLRELRKHFRRFAKVSDHATGKPLYFRFYDPALFRLYISHCSADEARDMFGPASSFLLEDVDPSNLSILQVVDNALRVEYLSIS